jgi:predicted MFS family arabinose efflux permease
MVFLVDFVARGLRQGIHAGAQYWVLFGVGAVAGPVLAGLLADRVGFGPALRLALVAQAAAVAVPVVTAAPVGLALSSVLIGAAVPGIVPLVLGRVDELVPGDPEGQRAAWSVTTMAFALGQAAGAYGLSFLFARGARYPTLFAVGTAALTLALVIDVTARLAGRKAI